MKTNAPDKIYIALDEFTEDERTFVLDHRVDYPICTEYTRTDAFIEKACEWINEHTSLSEKLVIENFKKYMEGE